MLCGAISAMTRRPVSFKPGPCAVHRDHARKMACQVHGEPANGEKASDSAG